MQPTGTRVMIRLIPKEENRTHGGLVIPDSVDMGPQLQKAELLAVGPGDRSVVTGNLIPLDFTIGDKVYVGPPGRFHGYKLADGTILCDVKEIYCKD